MNLAYITMIARFCTNLKSIAGEMSEHRIIWCLKNLDKELANIEKSTDNKQIIHLIHRMMADVENLEKAVEKVGFGQYMEDYPKIITAYEHEVEEGPAGNRDKTERNIEWNDYVNYDIPIGEILVDDEEF